MQSPTHSRIAAFCAVHTNIGRRIVAYLVSWKMPTISSKSSRCDERLYSNYKTSFCSSSSCTQRSRWRSDDDPATLCLANEKKWRRKIMRRNQTQSHIPFRVSAETASMCGFRTVDTFDVRKLNEAQRRTWWTAFDSLSLWLLDVAGRCGWRTLMRVLFRPLQT